MALQPLNNPIANFLLNTKQTDNTNYYENIYNIAQFNTMHVTSPLYHLKFIFQSLITLHMNHTLK